MMPSLPKSTYDDDDQYDDCCHDDDVVVDHHAVVLVPTTTTDDDDDDDGRSRIRKKVKLLVEEPSSPSGNGGGGGSTAVSASTPPPPPTTTTEQSQTHSQSSFDASSFFLNDPISPEEIEAVEPTIIANLEKVMTLCQSRDPRLILKDNARAKRQLRRNRIQQNRYDNEQSMIHASINSGTSSAKNGNSDYQIRDYQIALLEIAKLRNSIVHLGTGTGKTLIALRLIEYLHAEHDDDEDNECDYNEDGGGADNRNDDNNETFQSQSQQLLSPPPPLPPPPPPIGTSSTITTNDSNGEGGGGSGRGGGNNGERDGISVVGSNTNDNEGNNNNSGVMNVGGIAGDTNQEQQRQQKKTRKEKNRTQTVFLVPSVALAMQQTAVLKVHLPAYKIGTACSKTPESQRKPLSKVDVLVATHGAYLDLLSHYGDMFNLTKVKLLVLDECHNAIGSSNYANIMKSHYHAISDRSQRPRVLGLTASPLINVKKQHDQQHLGQQLETLESLLDARIVSLKELQRQMGGNDDNDQQGSGNGDDGCLILKDAYETTVTYRKERNEMAAFSFPKLQELDLLQSRRQELYQLEDLLHDLGPYILGVCASTLRHGLQRNTYQGETGIQFDNALHYLDQVRAVCQSICNSDTVMSGRTDKLLALEQLIEKQLYENPDAVGLVFVRQRVTAVALKEYFRRRSQAEKHNNPWPDAERLRLQHRQLGTAEDGGVGSGSSEGVAAAVGDGTAHGSQYFHPDSLTDINHDIDDQFMDAEDDPLLQLFNNNPGSGNRSNDDDIFDYEEKKGGDQVMVVEEEEECDQFGDADSCDDPSSSLSKQQQQQLQSPLPPTSTNTPTVTRRERTGTMPSIRCGALVRKLNNLFKILQRSNDVQATSTSTTASTDGTTEEEEKEDASFFTSFNQVTNVRVLNELRRGDINVLVATSVVEEGVDVKACSYVAAFDKIPNTKSYVQMKGRARAKNAKFFVFDTEANIRSNNISSTIYSAACAGVGGDATITATAVEDNDNINDKIIIHNDDGLVLEGGGGGSMTATTTTTTAAEVKSASTTSKILPELQYGERAVRDFLSNRDDDNEDQQSTSALPTEAANGGTTDNGNNTTTLPYGTGEQGISDGTATVTTMDTPTTADGSSDSLELNAVKLGYYKSPHAIVHLRGAKSLLNRFALAQPIDPAARITKDALRSYLPAYDNEPYPTKLYLPAHIADMSLRTIHLPDQYKNIENKKMKQSIMSLMACVRLHQSGLLSDRLLPLSQESIQSKIMEIVTAEIRLRENDENEKGVLDVEAIVTTNNSNDAVVGGDNTKMAVDEASTAATVTADADAGADVFADCDKEEDKNKKDSTATASSGNKNDSTATATSTGTATTGTTSTTKVYVYRIVQDSHALSHYREQLGASHKHLAIVIESDCDGDNDNSTSIQTKINKTPSFKQCHPEFQNVTLSLKPAVSSSSPAVHYEREYNDEQLDILSNFFQHIFNGRWKRKTRTAQYEFNPNGAVEAAAAAAAAAAATINPRRRHSNNNCKHRRRKAPLKLPVYRVGCIDDDGNLLWDYMEQTIQECNRTVEERTNAVHELSEDDNDDDVRQQQRTIPPTSPRLWSPIYDDKTMYVVYGPSNDCSSAAFPQQQQDASVATTTTTTVATTTAATTIISSSSPETIRTYQDYFKQVKHIDVPAESRLYEAQRLWHLPSRGGRTTAIKKRPRETLMNEEENIMDDKFAQNQFLCDGLVPVRLPKHACRESSMPDAGLCLLTTFLPQVLYHFERSLRAQAFVDHCIQYLPQLGSFLLDSVPVTEVIGVLSAKSCEEGVSYERLEWLGDAVLKLAQTEIILKATGLRKWIRNMHEGNLNQIRSLLGSNKRLKRACKRLGIDRYILTAPLARGQWTPSCMILKEEESDESMSLSTLSPSADAVPVEQQQQQQQQQQLVVVPFSGVPDGKICADVLEGLLGFVYVHGSYELSMQVAKEFQATIPWEDTYFNVTTSTTTPPEEEKEEDTEQKNQSRSTRREGEILDSLRRFTDYKFSKEHTQLAFEALTHPTALNPETPSYQRLEWLGDAVLGLCARCWIFRKFPSHDVSTMVLMESSLVSNETLAYLSLKGGLHRSLLHNDPTMQDRIDSYASSVELEGKGLWGTQPPKAIADIVEATFGAIHIDGGYLSGQRAVVKALDPVLSLLDKASEQNSLLRHPKRMLLEVGGKMTSLCTLDEGYLAKEEKGHGDKIWRGTDFQTPQRDSRRSVAVISCVGVNLIRVDDDTPSAATNRACSLILAVLNKNPKLLQRFETVRAMVMRSEGCSTNFDDEEEDE